MICNKLFDGMINRPSRRFVVCFMMKLFLVLYPNILVANTAYRDSSSLENLINSDRYIYFEKGGEMSFRFSSKVKTDSLFEPLFKIESSDNKRYSLFLLSAPEYGADLLWMHDSEAMKRKLWTASELSTLPDTVLIKLVMNLASDSIKIIVGDKMLSYGSAGLEPYKSYKISQGDNDNMTQYHEQRLIHLERNEIQTSNTAWYWFVLLIVVDICIFGLMLLRRRKSKQVEDEAKKDARAKLKDKTSSIILPSKNAIYLFGRVQIYDKNGEEIASKFSPLLKELFVCLVLYTADKGIPNDELIKLLWFDKSESSAKNNRAVNISKLRLLLADLDGCAITKEAGNWRIKFAPNVFIDYYEFVHNRNSFNKITPQRIEILSALISRGPFLQEYDVLWVDQFKNRLADNFIELLLKYNSLLGDYEESGTKLLISDIIFSFDSVNEEALHIKCSTYIAMNKRFMAKKTYDHFCQEYKTLYDEDYGRSFSSVISFVN